MGLWFTAVVRVYIYQYDNEYDNDFNLMTLSRCLKLKFLA